MELREIKFRIWDKNFESMLYPDSLIWFGDESCQRNGDMGYILQQYTGLKDSHGNDIWEGDILDIDNSGAIVEVLWFADGWAISDNRLRTPIWIGNDCEALFPYADCSTVVGNIYENKDLIK